MIEVKHITKKYGPNIAVNDISFTVEKGHVYGFLGPNGAGKSTTMNIICGCISATEGEVIVDGFDIYADPLEVRRRIGYLPEIPPLYTDMTPREYLRFIARAKKIDDIEGSVDGVMQKTSISSVQNRLIRNLSKGYRQRVGIAQAILGDPEIIVLDEPTVGLDPVQIIEIRNLIKELGKDHAVILSSHIMSEISSTCDYVVVIAHGRIVASDTLENLNRSFSGTEIITVESRSPLSTMKDCVRGLEGITAINGHESTVGGVIEIEVEPEKDIRGEVFDAFAKAGITLVRLESNSKTLEDIFIHLINEEHLEMNSESTLFTDTPSVIEQDAAKRDGIDESGSPYYVKNTPKSIKPDKQFEEYSTLFGSSDDMNDEKEGE